MFLFRKDSFTLTCATSLGRLTKVRIGHDNTGFGAAWFLDKVSRTVFIESVKSLLETLVKERK